MRLLMVYLLGLFMLSPEYKGVEPNDKYKSLEKNLKQFYHAYNLLWSMEPDYGNERIISCQANIRETKQRMKLVKF